MLEINQSQGQIRFVGQFSKIVRLTVDRFGVVYGVDPVCLDADFVKIGTLLPEGGTTENEFCRLDVKAACVVFQASDDQRVPQSEKHFECVSRLSAILLSEQPKTYLNDAFIRWCAKEEFQLHMTGGWRMAMVQAIRWCLGNNSARIIPIGILDVLRVSGLLPTDDLSELLYDLAVTCRVDRGVRSRAIEMLGDEERAARAAASLAIEMNGHYCEEMTRSQREWYYYQVTELLGHVRNAKLVERALAAILIHDTEDHKKMELKLVSGWIDLRALFSQRINGLS
jgi:hypothetical protein